MAAADNGLLQTLLRAEALNDGAGIAGLPRVQARPAKIRQMLVERQRRADINMEGIRAQAEKFHALKSHNISNFGQALETLDFSSALGNGAQAQLSDIEAYIKEGRNKALSAAIQTAQKEAERCFFEGHMQAMAADWSEESQEIRLALGNGRMLDPPVPIQNGPGDPRLPGPSMLTSDMRLFAGVVQQCGTKDSRATVHSLREAAQNRAQRADVDECWPVLEQLLTAPEAAIPGDAASDGGTGRVSMVPAAIACLQKRYCELMQEVLERNSIPSAKLSTREMIEKYAAHMCRNDCAGRGSERNAMVFYAWRCGHPKIAGEIDETFMHRYQDYLHSARTPEKIKSDDEFEQQISNLLARNHASEAPLATCFDDWLWIKLLTLPVRSTDVAFGQLQHSISVQFGEAYFQADQFPLRYVTTLTLTMQFEKAVEFLWRTDILTAVHYAIACQQTGRLVICERLRGERLESRPNGVSAVNLAQLISVYARTFVRSDPVFALAYFALIKDVPLDESKKQTCLERAVCDLVLESGDWELVFGSYDISGKQLPGLARRLLSSEAKWKHLVQAVAKESDRRGRFNDALRLYDLCNMPENVVQLLIRLLGQEAASPGPKRTQLRLFTDNVLRRYDAQRPDMAVVRNLSNMMTCFEALQENRLSDLAIPLEELYRAKLLPRRDDEVKECIELFKALSPEIKSNMPLLLLCAMKNLHFQLKTSGPAVRRAAQALMGFTSALPYRTPESIRAQLLQLNQSMVER